MPDSAVMMSNPCCSPRMPPLVVARGGVFLLAACPQHGDAKEVGASRRERKQPWRFSSLSDGGRGGHITPLVGCAMPWIRHRLRDADVWAKVDAQCALVRTRPGASRSSTRRRGGARVYRAGGAQPHTVARGPDRAPIEIEVGEPRRERTTAGASGPSATVGNADAIHVWDAMARARQPRPAGLGVVITTARSGATVGVPRPGDEQHRRLTAILRGLETIADRSAGHRLLRLAVLDRPAHAELEGQANKELVEELARAHARVRGPAVRECRRHSGIPLNERVDELARGANSRGPGDMCCTTTGPDSRLR